jgi:hypothetical protein
MPPFFDRFISPLSCVQLTRPLPNLDDRRSDRPHTESLANELRDAGYNRLGDILKNAHEHRLIICSEHSGEELDIHQGYLRERIHSFFSTQSLTRSVSFGSGKRTKSIGCDLRVHQIGEINNPSTSKVTKLFWSSCAVRVTGDTASLTAIQRKQKPGEVSGEEIAAIPATAGLTPHHAASLTAPVHQPPCEYIFLGDAGAVFSFCPDTFAVSAELSWSPDAYVGSLNALQEVGRWLIASNAIERAVQLGTGTRDIRGCSALLSKAYETAAQIGQTHEEPFLVSGLWGIAVLPRPKESYDYLLQVGVVGLTINQDDLQDLSKLALIRDRSMVIVNVQLSRDELGFVSMVPEKVSTFPLQRIEWHSSLPVLDR